MGLERGSAVGVSSRRPVPGNSILGYASRHSPWMQHNIVDGGCCWCCCWWCDGAEEGCCWRREAVPVVVDVVVVSRKGSRTRITRSCWRVEAASVPPPIDPPTLTTCTTSTPTRPITLPQRIYSEDDVPPPTPPPPEGPDAIERANALFPLAVAPAPEAVGDDVDVGCSTWAGVRNDIVGGAAAAPPPREE